MVRKGNQQKNSLDRKAANRRQTISDPTDVSLSEQKEKWKVHSKSTVDSEFYSGGTLCWSSSTSGEHTNETNCKGNGKRNKQRHCSVPCAEKSDLGSPESVEGAKPSSSIRNAAGDEILFEATETRSADGILSCNNHNRSCNMSSGLSMKTVASHVRSSITVACQRLSLVALDVFNAGNGWFEQQKPRLSTFKAYICNGRDYILVQIKDVYPIIWTWILHLGRLIFLLCVIWLDCNIRGLSSLLHLGTTSFFTIIWCTILWIISMVGFTKALIFTVISAIVGVFVGLGFGFLSLAIFGAVSLWLYGSFWTTTLVMFIGGSTFASGHERVALLVTTLYSTYCAKSCVGWLGLLLGLNLSFLSSEILTYFIRNNASEQESYSSAEQDRQTPTGASYFYGEPSHSSSVDDASASPSSGIPSTSGCDAELTSEGEVLRLLNCNDHYSALGFTRFENIDVSLLKREYRKKAMLVHPDKNMGNEKAAEAFKKLQNAYEVLLDTLKRKTYDDELRREELLNYFLRFQNASRKNGKHSIFSSGSNHFEADGEGSHEESRRIACKKCGDFHKWTSTGRPKSRARWCQDCNDFHQAKDGDGWLEQSLHPFLFGLLHKVDPPCAFVCAEGRIYDATEWFICQGMRCPANTHKPSFHVNTTLSSKHNNSGKGASSSSYRGGGPMPDTNNLNETMTEEEFFELLQHAMQSGAFEASGSGGGGGGGGGSFGSGSTNESPSPNSGGSSKGGSSSNVKKKRKGKKQW